MTGGGDMTSPAVRSLIAEFEAAQCAFGTFYLGMQAGDRGSAQECALAARVASEAAHKLFLATGDPDWLEEAEAYRQES
jgi:hypothetical protein